MIKHFYKTGLKTVVIAIFFAFPGVSTLSAQCPRIEAIMVNACGQEEDNEFIVIHAGNGFNTSDLQLSFPSQANSGGAVNDDININLGNQGASPCGLIPGNPALIGGCTNVTAVGPGVNIPANSILILQTSAGADATYDFSALCGGGQCVLVIANACNRSVPAFAQTGTGTRQVILQINGACVQTIDYDISNGNFVNNGGYYLPLTDQYGNAGCVVPPTSPAPRKPDIAPLTDVTSCGPYQLPPVPGTGITANAAYFTGPNRTGTQFVAGDLITTTTTLFAHDFAGGCFDQETFTVTVSSANGPVATLSGGGSSCEGTGQNLLFNITGTPPFVVQYTANGVLQAPLLVPNNSAVLPVNPSQTTTYELVSVTEQPAGCTGQATGQAVVTIQPAPTAVISGGGVICSGDSATIRVDLTGQAPYQLVLAIDGASQPAITVPGNTYTFKVSPPANTTYTVFSVRGSDNCRGPVAGFQSGEAKVTVAEAPMATLFDGVATVCSGQEAAIDVDLAGVGPFTLVYAIDQVAQPAVVTSDPQYTIMDTPAPGTHVYELISIHSNNCQGSISGKFTLTVTEVPTAVISGDTLGCPGGRAAVQVKFTGTGPYQFAIETNGVKGSTQVWTDSIFPYQPLLSGTTTFKVVDFSANGCPGTVSGSVTVRLTTPPSAQLTGDTTFCLGSAPGKLIVTFQGPGPYTFVYSANNGPRPSITTTDNPYIISITPTAGTIYRLVSVSTGSCQGTATGQVFTRIFTRPTVLLTGDSALCVGTAVPLNFNFTGTGPFTVAYSANGIAQPAFTTQDDPFVLPVTVDSNTVFVVDSVRSPGCRGIETGSATVTIHKAPTFSMPVVDCNPNNLDYTVSFDVLNGTPPYTLVSGSGSFTGNRFTSTPLLRSDPYSFTFRDVNNCGDVTVSGIGNCTCTTKAGTMSQTLVEACANATATVPAVTGQVTDNNDVVRYVLQSNPGLPLGTIFAWNTQPRFTLQPGMNVNTTYYISAITGNPGANNEVDLNDPCLGVAAGTPILFHPAPTAYFFEADTGVCQGSPITLTVSINGFGPWSFQAAINGTLTPQVSNINAPFYKWTFTPTQSGLITIDSLSDKFCKTGTGTDSVKVDVFGKPVLNNVIELCDYDKGTYVLKFDVTSGAEPFVVTGVTGTFTGKTFTSDPIVFGTPYSLTVKDRLNCGTTALNGAGICKCTTNAGTMTSTILKQFCVGTNATATHSGNQQLANGDVLRYILHTSSVDTLGTIIATGNSPNFAFDPANMQVGVTYYISAVGGRLQNGNLIIPHPCLSVAPGTPVRWVDPPAATLSGNFDICPGETEVLTINFTGTPPFDFSYTQNNGPVINGSSLQNTYDITATLIESTAFVLTAVSNAGCTGTASGTGIVTVHEKPQIANLSTSCNLDGDEFILTFNVAGLESGNIPVFSGTVTGNWNPNTGLFVGQPAPTMTPYSITVQDTLWGCGDTTVTGIVNCPCVTSAGTLPQTPVLICMGEKVTFPSQTDLFLAPKDTVVYVLATGFNPATWTIVATSGIPDFSFDPLTMTAGTTYFMTAVAGNKGGSLGIDLSDPCLSLATGPQVEWRRPVKAVFADSTGICQGDTLTRTIHLTGEAPFQFTLTGDGAPQNLTANGNTYTFKVAPAVSVTYTLSNVTDKNGCTATVDGPMKVTVKQKPEIINRTAVCAPDNESYVVEFDISNAATDAASIQITGTNSGTYDATTGHFISDPIPAFTPYNFTVTGLMQNCGKDTIQGVSACKCLTSAGAMDQTPIVLCPGAIAMAPPVVGSVLDSKDTLVYALTTAPNQPNWQILVTSPIPSFVFNPATMQNGTTYYVVALAGNKAGSGVDITDPCFSMAFGPTVTWRVAPAATIAGADSICLGDTAVLRLNFTGDGPYSFTLNTGAGIGQNYATAQTSFDLPVSPAVNTTYNIMNLTGAGGCPGASTGNASIFVRPLPGATLSGDTSICPGAGLSYPVVLNGVAPFELVYSLNGTVAPPVTSTQSTYTISLTNVQQPTKVGLVVVKDAHCANLANGTLEVNLLEPPKASLRADTTICQGDSAVLHLVLSGATAFDLSIGGGPAPVQLNGVQNGATVTFAPDASTTYAIVTAQASDNSCPVQIGVPASVDVRKLNISADISDYTGYNISCPDADDGYIVVIVIGGGLGLNYRWSTGSTQPRLENLGPGTYNVTVSDQLGCTANEEFVLREPAAIEAQFSSMLPSCFESSDGSITIDGIRGGLEPYTLLIDNRVNVPTGTLPITLSAFKAGNYTVSIEDARACVLDTVLTVPAPPELTVDLGPDLSIPFGDSVLLEAQTSYPVDTFIWSPTAYLQAPNAAQTGVKPPATVRYKLIVRDAAGCQASDDIVITVSRNTRIYVPNTLNPESDTENGLLTVYAGAEVSNITQFRIFDRWGNSVFERNDIQPNDPTQGWDGRWNGKKVNPGVFVYLLEVEYFDGRKEMLEGDITVVR